MEATRDQREAEKESLGFYVGGKHQWRPGETEFRQGNNRPWMTINRCRPAVDQVANEARSNPPGPEAHPVGGGADKDTADILEGMIREYEYRSNANSARVNALTYGCAGGRGVWELATEYAGERTMEQQLVVKYVDDPAVYFYDPDARLPGRQDSMWGGHIRKFSREALIAEYGINLKVFNRNLFEMAARASMTWMSDAVGWSNDFTTSTQWAGGAGAQGPFFVCDFYRVQISQEPLRLYTDNVLRFDDEKPPAGISVRTQDNEFCRIVPRRSVWKYVVTAFDMLQKTRWPGTIVPHFWLMGPEIWIDGKLYRLTLIDGAKDAQRGLNYTATSVAEIVGGMTKSPWIGWEGQFDVANAQGFNPWESSNTQMWAYMEVKPVFATDPTTMQSQLLPAPQRNTWEAPIARLMEAATWFGEQIKAATSVFFEPALPSAAQIQSGEAIKALQAQTNIGTMNWQDALHNTTQLEYWQAAIILPQLYGGPRVRTIVRPDTQHEVVEINREFPPHEIDAATGKWRGPNGKLESLNNIGIGQYSLRVTAGPSVKTRTEESINKLTEVFKIAPNILQSPVVTSRFLRMVGEGNPEVESLADAIMPADAQQATPEQLQAQMQQLSQQNQAKDFIIQRLQQLIQSKMPEIEAKKWIAALNAIAGIREAEIKAGVDKAENDLSMLEHITGMAHDRALQATEHQQAQTMAAQQAEAAAAQDQNSGEESQ